MLFHYKTVLSHTFNHCLSLDTVIVSHHKGAFNFEQTVI